MIWGQLQQLEQQQQQQQQKGGVATLVQKQRLRKHTQMKSTHLCHRQLRPVRQAQVMLVGARAAGCRTSAGNLLERPLGQATSRTAESFSLQPPRTPILKLLFTHHLSPTPLLQDKTLLLCLNLPLST
mmetsp:Transcript_24798/g.63937  ORF Transcript_24798/g.63937 Transcript_24798/m.63937 type:complete len:128 (-) Transcript_24798:326-709(-)